MIAAVLDTSSFKFSGTVLCEGSSISVVTKQHHEILSKDDVNLGANVIHVVASLQGQTLLHFAALHGSEDMLMDLLLQGADACAVDEQVCTQSSLESQKPW